MRRSLCTIVATTLSLTAFTTPFEYAYDRGETVAPTLIAYHSPYRLVRSVDPSGRTLEMDDSAIWVIANSSQREVIRWLKNDPLIIYPCLWPAWYGGSFWIFNEKLGTYAYADLSLGPVINGDCTNHIIQIDFYRGEIVLRDARGYQNLWRVSTSDLNLLTNWRLGDSIIIGSNQSPAAQWQDRSDYILINVAENMYVRSNIVY
ncbi:MAG: hypothetical protein HY860_06440 [Chlamydiales bacterium]|nr:hypothetical protein [Chlamydiales bacterium]